MNESQLHVIIDNIIYLKSLFNKSIGKSILLNSSITPAAFQVLLCLKKNGPLPMSEIARQLDIPKPNLTALIDKLIDEKLSERLPNVNDRRIVIIKLSKKGLLFIEKKKRIFSDQIKKKMDLLTDKELEVFSNSLQNVMTTLSRISAIDEN